MKNIYKLILGIVGAGTITTAGIVTANKIMDNNRGKDMKNTVETMSIVSQNEVEEEKKNENLIENIAEEITEVSKQPKETEQTTTTTVPIPNEPIEENKEPTIEKEIICTIPIVGEDWEENTEFKLELNNKQVYIGKLMDKSKDIKISIKGKGNAELKLYTNGVLKIIKMVDFNAQTNIKIP